MKRQEAIQVARLILEEIPDDEIESRKTIKRAIRILNQAASKRQAINHFIEKMNKTIIPMDKAWKRRAGNIWNIRTRNRQ